MKVLFWLGLGPAARAQPNPLAYPEGSPSRRALALYQQALTFRQGGRASQLLLDSVTRVAPTLAWAWAERPVPYLKRGEFGPWYALLGRAAVLAPTEWLGYRADCHFETLRDYAGALRDLACLGGLRTGQAFVGYYASGDYDLRIVQALCERELHQRVGLYEYLPLAAARCGCIPSWPTPISTWSCWPGKPGRPRKPGTILPRPRHCILALVTTIPTCIPAYPTR